MNCGIFFAKYRIVLKRTAFHNTSRAYYRANVYSHERNEVSRYSPTETNILMAEKKTYLNARSGKKIEKGRTPTSKLL